MQRLQQSGCRGRVALLQGFFASVTLHDFTVCQNFVIRILVCHREESRWFILNRHMARRVHRNRHETSKIGRVNFWIHLMTRPKLLLILHLCSDRIRDSRDFLIICRFLFCWSMTPWQAEMSSTVQCRMTEANGF